MSKLIPEAGMLFYAEPTWYLCDLNTQDHVIVESQTKNKDRSYSEKIMRCLGTDGTVVVAEVAWGSCYGNKPHMFRLSEYEFQPVGPSVVDALGLIQDVKKTST